MLKSRIENLSQKKLIGYGLQMSFAANTTHELWRTFMPRRNEIQAVGGDLYSVQQYAPDFFDTFNPNTTFKKWAGVEAADITAVPDGMEQVILAGGLYAVFDYKGDARNAAETFQYILGIWLPQSAYVLDNSRHHFEILGEKYKKGDPDSEEEIWIPVQQK